MKTINLEDKMTAREKINLIGNATIGMTIYFSFVALILI